MTNPWIQTKSGVAFDLLAPGVEGRARALHRRAAAGKASKRTYDKKLSAEARAEIAASTERGRDLAARFGVSESAISWIRRHWKRARAA